VRLQRIAPGIVLFLFLATATVLAACGGGSSSEPTSVPADGVTTGEGTPISPLGPPPPTATPFQGTWAQIRVDADPETPGIQTEVTRAVGETFKVRWNLDQKDTPDYQGYQGKMAVDETILAIESGAPLGAMCGSDQTCAPAGPVISNEEIHTEELDESQGFIFGGEVVVEPRGTTSGFAGDVYEVELQCLAAGTSPLDLRPPPEDPLNQNTSLLLDFQHPTETFDAQVTCQGASQ
jgi:hypothetical protein